MRSTFVAVVAFTLAFAYGITTWAQGGAPAAPPTGDPTAGKAHYALGNTSCRNCHGGDGEGAFGPALAGRIDLTFERFRNYVRNPAGRMPAYIEAELTDQEIADMVAYFTSLPPATKPAAWRTPLPEGAPRGQQLAIAVVGCAQCHGATFETPRHGMFEVNGDFEWFKHMVYDHTNAQREQWQQLDPSIPRTTPVPAGPPGRNRIRMGNYSRQRLPENILKEIYDWAADLGPLATLAVSMTPAQNAPAGQAVYNLTVYNSSVKGKGPTVEDITVSLEVPDNVQVINAVGTGYAGTSKTAEGKTVATWKLPKLAATEQQALSITLSAPASGLRGHATWGKPAVKADPEVTFAIGRGGRGAA